MNDNTDEAETEVEKTCEQTPMDIEDCAYDEELSIAYIENTVDVNSASMEFWVDIVAQIKAFDDGRKKGKWKTLSIEKFKNLLRSDPSVLLRTFSKAKLLVCGKGFQDIVERVSKKPLLSLTKLELVNTFSVVFGSSKIIAAKRSPPKLKKILKDMLVKNFNKEAMNAITATKLFIEQDLPAWRQENIFKDGINIGNDNTPFIWYSRPEYFNSVEEYIVYLLDCHHLFVNARSYVCQHDIAGLNVKRDAWVQIAESSDALETGLNKAMVVDLIDRQSNAIAQIVFGEKVEKKMIEKGWTSEANFCKCMREWYKAEDEAGLDIDTRYKYRMNIRNLLLNSVNLADFPPPGSHVGGIPIVMFEGILTNTDRRLQLHALVPGNAYNVRAPNTLAVENLFGGFQDLDPKYTGVLFPDDIPHAIETASYLIKTRLDPERAFEMRTTRSSKVYPTNAIHVPTEATCELNNIVQPICNLTRIPVRSHTFDNPKTEKRKPKRKVASIPDYRMPSRGTQPIRQFHKADTSKIFPHVRHGLNFE